MKTFEIPLKFRKWLLATLKFPLKFRRSSEAFANLSIFTAMISYFRRIPPPAPPSGPPGGAKTALPPARLSFVRNPPPAGG